MKKTLIYAGAVLVLAGSTLISVNYASAKIDDSQALKTENSSQSHTNKWRLVKHSFQLHIPQNEKALSQLIIETPSTVAVSNDIEVLDTTGKKININVSANGKQIVIDFPAKAIFNSKLIINFNRVKQPISGPASIYRLSAKVIGSDVEIPIGLATFKTF